MKVGDFGLLEDRQFVSGLASGVGLGGLLGYMLGWEQALGVGPGVLSIPCLLLAGVGQWFGWAAVVQRRQAVAASPSPSAEPGAAADPTKAAGR